jgi:RimJ/RimL family protein N-acetyltransferase
MKPRLQYERLLPEHLDQLVGVLLSPAVYEHLEDHLPSLTEFKRGLERAMAGPPPEQRDQIWLNYLVRQAETGQMLGRLEATIHDGLAEVAFLFDPSHWGKGYAREGLAWLHARLGSDHGISRFWATTVPANWRSQKLLLASGYRQIHGQAPRLLSFELGDLVFFRAD